MSDAFTFDFAAFRAHIHNLAFSNPGKVSPRELTLDVIKQSLEVITKTLGISLQIATVRERSGYRKQRLRHIYASPENIGHYFDIEDVVLDGITSHAFEDPSATLRTPSGDAGPTTSDNIYYTLFNIKDKLVVRLQPEATKKGRYVFPKRIDFFLEKISSNDHYSQGISFDKINGCLVLGLSNSKLGKGETDKPASIDCMVALYFTYQGNLDDLKAKIPMCTHLVAEMFRTLGEMSVRERLDFERQALQDIVGLVPVFANKNVSPSDAVAALLKKFAKIFKKHEYFGPGRYHSMPKKRTRQHQWVTFLSITYRGHKKEEQTPILEVYPKSEAKKNYVHCYRVANPETPSISKYLLYQYLKQSSKTMPQVTPAEFSNVDVSRNAFLPAKKSAPPKGLVLTSNDKKAWKELVLDIVREGVTKTTAAFLLRRPAHKKTRPFAILVFESDYVDAFSRADIELISRLVDASASLLSYIKLGSNSIDYSERMKEAFAGMAGRTIGKVLYTKIMYELLRFDCHAAKKILEYKGERIWRNSSLAQREVRERVLKIIRKLDNDKLAGDQVALYRWLRSQIAIELIEKEWKDNIQDIHKFLMAVPANDVWYCYLGSIARALADRRFGDSKLPTFTQYHPGYSALAMFVVGAPYQTAQIVKLTTKEKLEREQANYIEHVRHKILLAARIPANGVAFDTIGTAPKKKSTRDSRDIGYGIIISDLITGVSGQIRPTPISFLTLCAELTNRDNRETQLSAANIAEAITHHFTENIKIWRDEGKLEWAEQSKKKPKEFGSGSVAPLIEDLTGTGAKRSPYTTRHNYVNIDKRLSNITDHLLEEPTLSNATFRMLIATCKYFKAYIKYPNASNTEIVFDRFRSLPELVKELQELRPNHAYESGNFIDMVAPQYFEPSFVHGDMNGNNLTWAANYNRFVMIDFESIRLGFVGADQLKLLASMICETVIAARRSRREREVTDEQAVRDIEHYDMVSLVRLVSLLIGGVIKVEDPHKRAKTLEKLSEKAREKKASLLDVAIAIIRTIEFDKLELPTADEQLFWRWTLRNLFYRQFEYAFRDIDTRHINALETVSESIEKVMNDVKKPARKKVDDFTFLNETSPNVLESADYNNVIMLFYSFLTLLGTI